MKDLVTPTKHTITLHCADVGWVATSDNPSWKEMFGTDTLATGFTSKAEPLLVLAEITRLNPDNKVMLAIPARAT